MVGPDPGQSALVAPAGMVRVLVEAMKYLAKDDPQGNRGAIELLSEHFRTQFRMTDRPN